MKTKVLLTLLVAGCVLLFAAHSQAAFVVAVDLDPVDGPQTLHPNFSFGNDTTSASDSTQSFAVGLAPHQSLFGGNGVTDPDTYVIEYTPGVDTDNFSPASGSLLGSTTGFGTETATGFSGGASGLYNVYITGPDSTNIDSTSTATATGDGAPAIAGPGLVLNNGGTGADLDGGPAYVGGFNNAWYKVGTVDMTMGTTYTLTLESSGGNTFVSQRLAGVLWEAVVPEPTSFVLIAMGGLALIGFGRRKA